MKSILLTLGLMISTQAFALPVGETWGAQSGRGQFDLTFLKDDAVTIEIDPNRCQIDWKGDRSGMCTRMATFTRDYQLEVVQQDRQHTLFQVVGTNYQIVERRAVGARAGSLRLLTKSDSGTKVDVLEQMPVAR